MILLLSTCTKELVVVIVRLVIRSQPLVQTDIGFTTLASYLWVLIYSPMAFRLFLGRFPPTFAGSAARTCCSASESAVAVPWQASNSRCSSTFWVLGKVGTISLCNVLLGVSESAQLLKQFGGLCALPIDFQQGASFRRLVALF